MFSRSALYYVGWFSAQLRDKKSAVVSLLPFRSDGVHWPVD